MIVIVLLVVLACVAVGAWMIAHPKPAGEPLSTYVDTSASTLEADAKKEVANLEADAKKLGEKVVADVTKKKV